MLHEVGTGQTSDALPPGLSPHPHLSPFLQAPCALPDTCFLTTHTCKALGRVWGGNRTLMPAAQLTAPWPTAMRTATALSTWLRLDSGGRLHQGPQRSPPPGIHTLA